MTLTNTTVSGSIHGAGIMNHLAGSVLRLLNCTVSGNGGTDPNDSGGILNDNGSVVVVTAR